MSVKIALKFLLICWLFESSFSLFVSFEKFFWFILFAEPVLKGFKDELFSKFFKSALELFVLFKLDKSGLFSKISLFSFNSFGAPII